MPDQDGDKKHDPTPHRRRQAREKGQVAKSQDLASSLLLVIGLILLMTLGAAMVDFLGSYSRVQLGGHMALRADVNWFVAIWTETLVDIGRHLIPIMLTLMAAAVVVNIMQIGFMFLPDKLAFDFSRLDIIKGLQRMFSMQSFARLGFGILKVIIVATVAGVCVVSEIETIVQLGGRDMREIAIYLCSLLLWTSLKIGLALLILALLDFWFQFWKQEQDLKMTDQEVKEEYKNMEGDPQTKAKRRQIQRELAQGRTSEAVPKADIVVTNPTELAIAIKYDPEEMPAPIIVAKGAGFIAQQIRRLALEHGIPIVEKKPLAQALYRDAEVGDQIPPDNYAAVAEVLAYVYQLKNKKLSPEAQRRAQQSQQRQGRAG